MNPPHHGGKIKYDLSFSSLPWILAVCLKPGKHCEQISDLELELQVMIDKFDLFAIIQGDEKHILLGFQ